MGVFIKKTERVTSFCQKGEVFFDKWGCTTVHTFRDCWSQFCIFLSLYLQKIAIFDTGLFHSWIEIWMKWRNTRPALAWDSALTSRIEQLPTQIQIICTKIFWPYQNWHVLYGSQFFLSFSWATIWTSKQFYWLHLFAEMFWSCKLQN